jgi:CheY-like chemotaxis protein
MARVLALTADLLFGSRLQSDLTSGGHQVELINDPERLRAWLAENPDLSRWVLVVDLTDPALDGSAVLESIAAMPAMASAATLGFYSHVEVATRTRGKEAGFDMLVPRSRMARESASLVGRLGGADG